MNFDHRYNFDIGESSIGKALLAAIIFKDETMAEEEVAEVAAADLAPQGGGKNPFVTLLLIVNAALIGTVAYFQFSAHQREANAPDIKDIVKSEMKAIKEAEEEGDSGPAKGSIYYKKKNEHKLFPLDPFTANLAQGDGPKRFLRMNAVLKFSLDSSEEEFKARTAQVRDTVISILNSKRPEDLLKVEGKQFLKEEIKAAINSFFVDGRCNDVYYTSFQIN